jgi:hypothetical protein
MHIIEATTRLGPVPSHDLDAIVEAALAPAPPTEFDTIAAHARAVGPRTR